MKKGQITIFVVIGFVLLIIVGILIFINKVSKEVPPGEEIEYTFEESKVKQHIEFCLASIAEEGLRKLGDSGGYIHPEEYGFVAIGDMPTSSSAVAFSPESDYVIPYWYYMKSSNKCLDCYFSSGQPPIEKTGGTRSVEYQLAYYINNNLDKCVDFSQFKEFEVKEDDDSEVNSEVVVGESRVVVSAEYPLKIIGESNSVQEISDFEASLDLNLKKFFDIADEIMSIVKRQGFFEQVTTELITVNSFSDGGKPSMPPISGDSSIDFKVPHMWTIQEVKEKLKIILADNIPNIQIAGSRDSFIFTSDNPYFQSFYMNLVIGVDYSPEVLEDIEINFLYMPWWDPYLRVTPGKGALIMESPDSIRLGFIDIMLLKNQFSYDVSYPVVVALSDIESFNGEGYSLKFAFEVNVRANSYYEFREEEDEELEGIEFLRPSLFSDPAHWNSGEVTINTVNLHDNSSIEDVSLTFTCGNEEIFLDNSLKDNLGVANIKTKLPVCLGGLISGFRHNYFVTSQGVDTLLDVDQVVNLHVEPKKTLNVLFKEKIVGKEIEGSNLVWKFRSSSERDVAFDERVIAIFTRIAQPGEDEFISQISFLGNQTEDPQIELVTGSYTVEAFLFKSGVVIPEEELCVDDECYTIPEMNFNESFYAGGLQLDNETVGYFNVTFDDLQNENIKVSLLAFEASDFTSSTDLEQLDEINNYIINNENYFWPQFE